MVMGTLTAPTCTMGPGGYVVRSHPLDSLGLELERAQHHDLLLLGVRYSAEVDAWFPRRTRVPGTRRPNTAGQIKIGLGRWICYKNNCEWTVLTYFLNNQPTPDEGSVNLFLLTTGSSPDLDLWRTPKHTHYEAIPEVFPANAEAFM